MKPASTLALLLLSATLSAVCVAPQKAAAAVRALDASACLGTVGQGFKQVVCGLTTGTDFPSSSLTGAYFDFADGANVEIQLSLSKHSFSGTLYTDNKDYITSSTSYNDVFVNAVNVKTAPSQYDYLRAVAQGGWNIVVLGVTLYNPN